MSADKKSCVSNATTLNDKRRAAKDSHDEHSRVRIHRAISWLARAEEETNDDSARFIFCWISFNAAYAREIGPGSSERGLLSEFFHRILEVDRQGCLRELLFSRLSDLVHRLVENRFVYEPFWRALREHDSSGTWENYFAASKRTSQQAISNGDTFRILSIVFDRLYVLRNQLVHGGATWNGATNKLQVQDGVTILMSVVPLIIDLMLENSDLDFGPINYPVVGWKPAVQNSEAIAVQENSFSGI